MVSDDELDLFIKEEVEKDITQEDSIDPSVDEHLGSMGWLWDRVNTKLKEDSVCFSCKKTVDPKKDKLSVLEGNKIDNGAIAFVGICEDCLQKIKEEQGKSEVKKNE